MTSSQHWLSEKSLREWPKELYVREFSEHRPGPPPWLPMTSADLSAAWHEHRLPSINCLGLVKYVTFSMGLLSEIRY